MNQLAKINLAAMDHFHNPYPTGFEKVDVPEGVSGDWSVSRFEVTESEGTLFNLRLIRDGQRRRVVPVGTYTRLSRKGEGVVMSDTPAEAWEHVRLMRVASGHVLLNGLGLGFALKALLSKPEVGSVTVIEKSADVIALVKPSIHDERVSIINADALTWRPSKGQRFDTVWHDIWTHISRDNKSQMTSLRRAYGRRCKWQSCWSEEYL